VRTPLTAVIGFSQLLRLHPAGDPAKVRTLAATVRAMAAKT